VPGNQRNGTRPAGGRRMSAGAKAPIQSIGQSGHKTGWLRERFTGQSAVKQEKDPSMGRTPRSFWPGSRHGIDKSARWQNFGHPATATRPCRRKGTPAAILKKMFMESGFP
jgi:hypothetical protein